MPPCPHAPIPPERPVRPSRLSVTPQPLPPKAKKKKATMNAQCPVLHSLPPSFAPFAPLPSQKTPTTPRFAGRTGTAGTETDRRRENNQTRGNAWRLDWTGLDLGWICVSSSPFAVVGCKEWDNSSSSSLLVRSLEQAPREQMMGEQPQKRLCGEWLVREWWWVF